MRSEKKFLVQEIDQHLSKSDYFFLTDFQRLSVTDAAELRTRLAKERAEFHVVKNRLFGIAAGKRELPDLSEHLKGHTAVVVGGENPSEVAKILFAFVKEKDKNGVKAGVVEQAALSQEECEALSRLPGRDELRAKLLGTLLMPGTNLARTLNAPAQGLATVLKARQDQLEEAS
jgi:large subunit ribosomal protein L10